MDTYIRDKHVVSQSHTLNIFPSVSDFDIKRPKIETLLLCEVGLHLLRGHLKHKDMNDFIP